MVLSAEVVELPRGARLSARTPDISLTGCYIDTLNPIPQGSEVRLRVTHNDEIFEAVGRAVFVSYGLRVGVAFTGMDEEQKGHVGEVVGESAAGVLETAGSRELTAYSAKLRETNRVWEARRRD
jgi:hypothetical protein